MGQELGRPGWADGKADGVFEIVFPNQQGDTVALEKDFCKSGAVLA
jgi:hypothetical protein